MRQNEAMYRFLNLAPLGRPRFLIALIAIGMIAVSATMIALSMAGASEPYDAGTIRRAVERGEVVPLPRILTLARKQVPGEVIKIEIEHEHGVLIYEIEILADNGRVREVKFNARTGALIAVEDD